MGTEEPGASAGQNAEKRQEIESISLPLPYRLGSVNCYLIDTGAGYILIDTGCANQRANLRNELVSAGCRPGDLRLIVLTHGDFDHTGNAAYLRDEFGARIAMHRGDAGMAERGDMFANRKKGNALLRAISLSSLGLAKRRGLCPTCTSKTDTISRRTVSPLKCSIFPATPAGPSES